MVSRRFGWGLWGGCAIAGVCLVSVAVVGCGVRTPLEPPLVEIVFADSGVSAVGSLSPVDSGASVDASDAAEERLEDGSASDDVALPPGDLGNVVLTSGAYQNGAMQTLVAQAVFYPSVTATGCTVAPVAAGCTLETCAGEPNGPAPLAGAGTIDVTGGFYPLVLDEQTPSTPYAPVVNGGSLTLWHGGEDLVVTASGGVVPAFTGDVVAPTQVTVLTPMPQAVSRASALSFSWFGASAGKLTVDLGDMGASADYYLECQFDVGAQTAEIPPQVLQMLPAGTARLTVSTVDRIEVGAGPWEVKIFAQTDANDMNGEDYSAILPLE